MIPVLIILFTACAASHAQDVLEMNTGVRRTGEILSADDKFIRLGLDIATPSGSLPLTRPTVAIPRADVRSIDFANSPERDAAMRSATVEDIPVLEGQWQKFSPWLEMPHSPAGAIGCALGNALLATKERRNADRALQLFTRIEGKSWQDSDKARAREGRLRAMTTTGRAAKAIEEAKALALETEDPEILIEANFLLAQAAEKELRAFLKENPRWEIDPAVIELRHRLHNRVLELYLQPSLFFGTDNDKAARGLWGAVGVYELCGEAHLAIETCRDILAFYPETHAATQAKTHLASLKPGQLAADWESEARQELLQEGHASDSSTNPAPTASPQESNKPAKEKKKKSP